MIKKIWKKLLLKKFKKTYDSKKEKRILFLTMQFGLGDGINSTDIIESLVDEYKVDTLGNVNQKIINKYNPKINNIYSYACNKNKTLKKSIIMNLKLILELRKNNYDIILDAHSSAGNFNLIFLRFIGGKKILGLKKVNNRYNFNENEITLYDKLFNTQEEMVNYLGLNLYNKKIYLPEYCIEKNKEYLQKNEIKIIFNTEGNSRAIERKKIIEILKLLDENIKEKIKIISTPQRRMEIEKILCENNFINVELLPETSFYDAVYFIKNCEILISPNTSLIHVASVYNKKILGIYSNVKWHIELWRPKIENYELVISEIETEDTDDLGEIDSRKVLIALKNLMEK